MTDFKVLVCGGRDFSDRHFLFTVLDKIHQKRPISTIIEGGAAGADRLARSWAEKNHVPVSTFPANWELHGRRAGPVRNCKMLREGRPNLVVAFKGGRGTSHMIRIATEAGIKIFCLGNIRTQLPIPTPNLEL